MGMIFEQRKGLKTVGGSVKRVGGSLYTKPRDVELALRTRPTESECARSENRQTELSTQSGESSGN